MLFRDKKSHRISLFGVGSGTNLVYDPLFYDENVGVTGGKIFVFVTAEKNR